MYTGLNTPEDYWRVIKNHKWMIIIPIVVGLAIAAALCQWLPKTYRSTAQIYFQDQKVMYVQGVGGPSSGSEAKSDSRVSTIMEMLYQKKVFTQLAEEFHLYGYDKATATPVQDSMVASRMRSMVKVEIDQKDSNILKLSFADAEPALARSVNARLTELLVEENVETRRAIALGSAEFIQHELDAMKEQLEAKERSLAQFKQTHLGQLPEQMESNLRAIDRLEMEATGQREMERTLTLRLESIEKALREYEDPTSEVGAKRIEKDPRLAKIKELERTLAGYRSLYKDTYPDVARVKNEMRQLQSMTTEEYIALFIDQDPTEKDDPKKLKRKQVDPYKADLLKQREEILHERELVHMRQARIAADVKKYESRVEGTSVHQKELLAIERDYENLQKNYQSLHEKKLAAQMAGNLEQTRQGAQMHIVEQASLPEWPEKPNLIFVMFGGLAAGCGIGFGSAFGLEILRRGFVSAEEVEMTTGVPVIATISNFESAWPGMANRGAEVHRQGRLLALPGLKQDVGAVPGRMELAVGPEVVSMWYPKSAVTEQYRVATTRLGLMVGKQQSTVLVFSSAIMGEGKTSTSLNVAHVLARDLNKKTVLIDCDLKRPMVHTYAGMPSTAGLAEVLLGKKALEDCLEYHEQLRMWIIPAGNELVTTAALTHVDRLLEIIQTLRSRFEYIILDAPPLLPVAEALLIVRMADIVAHVVRSRSTRRDVVMSALKMMGQDRPLGIVLNGVEAKDAPYSYYSYGSVTYEPQHQQIT